MSKIMKKRFGYLICGCLLFLALLVTGLTVTAMAAEGDGNVAEGDGDAVEGDGIVDYVNPEEYISGYYEGAVSDSVSSYVNVRYGPGSGMYDIIETSTGKKVQLKAGTKMLILGETKDVDKDHWYHIKVEFDGEMIEGYAFSKHIVRSATQITFTPTPTPIPTDTPTPTITEIEKEEEGNVFADPTPTTSPANRDMQEKKELDSLKYVLILAGVVILFIIIYTVATKIQEERLEKEMERYSNRPAFQKLDEESDEDFKEAQKDYYDNQLQLGERGKRNLREEIGGDDEIELDLNGIFDEPAVKVKEEDFRPTYEEVGATGEDGEEEWTAEDAAFVEHLKASVAEEEGGLYDRMVADKVAPEVAETITEEVQEILPDVPSVDRVAVLRKKLDALKEQDNLYHKLYGQGEVIDNSDAEVIQVRFGRDLRFLKKEKLSKKELVELD